MEQNNFSDELLDRIIKWRHENKVAFMTCDGIEVVDVDELIHRSALSILYDLNRDETTTIALARGGELGTRWVNDLAAAFVIRKLKEELDKYKKLHDECKDTK